MIKKAEKLFQQLKLEPLMTNDKLNFFTYIRSKQTSSFSQTHTLPEPSKLHGFFTSIGSKTDVKLIIVVDLFFQEHVKNRYSDSPQ